MREVYVTREVGLLLDGAKGVPKDLLGPAGTALAIFDQFMAFRRVTMGMDPLEKHSSAIFARNSPVAAGVCDTRILSPKPQLRVFGGFALCDTFVALTYQRRKLLTFDLAVRRASARWRLLFPSNAPVVSEDVNDYISKPVTAV